jgi:hypothetical protein
MDKLLTADQVAELLGMKTDWVWAQARLEQAEYRMSDSAGIDVSANPQSKRGSRTLRPTTAAESYLQPARCRCAANARTGRDSSPRPLDPIDETCSGAERRLELERADQPSPVFSPGSRDKLDRNWTVTPSRTI